MFRLNHIPAALFVVALVAMAGCDSSEEETTDADRFLGQWQASSITAGSLDILSLVGTMTATFTLPSSFTLRAVDPSQEEILNASGTFTADDGKIVFTLSGAPKPVTISYAFESGDDTVVLTFAGSVLGELGFEIDPNVLALIGNQVITATLTRQ